MVARIQSQEAAQSVMQELKIQVEDALERSFDRYEVVGNLSAIVAIVGISYHFLIQTGEDECLQVRIFEPPESDARHVILALKLAKMTDKFLYLDPRDGYVQT